MKHRKILSFACFVIIAVSMILGTGNLLRDKSTTFRSVYSEPQNSIDVITVGSSHVNSGVIPAVLWKEYGVSAHNVFSWSQPVWVSYSYIKEALKTQDIKLVILDVYGVMYGNGNEQPEEIDKINYKNSFQLDESLNRLELIYTSKTCGIDLRDPLDFIDVIRYHNGWKNISEVNFTYDPHNDHDFMKSYGLQTRVEGCSAPVKPRDMYSQPPYEKCAEYLDKIIKLSEKENFELMFIALPYDFTDAEFRISQWIKEYSQEKGIPYLDFCSDNETTANIDYASDFADSSHLNYKGAFKISRYIGQYIKENFPELATGDSKFFDLESSDAKKTYRVFEVNENRTADYNKYFEYLKKDTDNHVLFASVQGVSEISDEFKSACELFGIEFHDNGFRGRFENGEWESFETKQTIGDVYINSTYNSSTINVKGTDYIDNNSPVKFTIYDKILEKVTMYVYYDVSTDELKFGDYPSKVAGSIY